MTDIGGLTAEQLRAYVERIERLEEEKAAIAADIKDIYAEAKGNGFDVKTIRQVVKLRKMDASDRDEQQALLDLYMHALGMLADTPLGEAAVRRLTRKPPPRSDSPAAPAQPYDQSPLPPQGGTAATAEPPDEAPAASDEPEDWDAAIAEARKEGAAAAEAGRPVTDNPYPPRDPRRAGYDEAWCQAARSDGMEIPEAWRRTPKPKKPKGGGGDDAGSGASPDDPGTGESA